VRPAILALALLLTGCVTLQTKPVTMKHADGRRVTCGPYPADGMRASAGAIQESRCIQDFQRQGYERAPE
jgi:PBP1b-binding outer membrane lipoprotein LpoB